jgi:hypothetical protein
MVTVPDVGISNEDTLIQNFPFPVQQSMSRTEATSNFETKLSIENQERQLADHDHPLLQQINPLNESSLLHPVNEDKASYDLIASYAESITPLHSLERQADLMFSQEHILALLSNACHLFKFHEFLTLELPRSLPILTYFLNAVKALKAIQYSNTLRKGLATLPEIEESREKIPLTTNEKLERQAQNALHALTIDELPAFITSSCINLACTVVEERIKGTLPPKFQGTADALAEAFCLTDHSRPDNPIIFASQGMSTFPLRA